MEYRWRFVVEDSFRITGRGLAVIGTFEGHGYQGDAARVEAEDGPFVVNHVQFEMADSGGRGFPAMVLGKLKRDPLPKGTVIHSID